MQQFSESVEQEPLTGVSGASSRRSPAGPSQYRNGPDVRETPRKRQGKWNGPGKISADGDLFGTAPPAGAAPSRPPYQENDRPKKKLNELKSTELPPMSTFSLVGVNDPVSWILGMKS